MHFLIFNMVHKMTKQMKETHLCVNAFWSCCTFFFLRELFNDQHPSRAGYCSEVNVVGAKEVVTPLIIRYEWQLLRHTKKKQKELASQSASQWLIPSVSQSFSHPVSHSVSLPVSQSVCLSVRKWVSLSVIPPVGQAGKRRDARPATLPLLSVVCGSFTLHSISVCYPINFPLTF